MTPRLSQTDAAPEWSWPSVPNPARQSTAPADLDTLDSSMRLSQLAIVDVSRVVSVAEPRKIIIVDDDDGVRDSTRVLLEAHGFAAAGFAGADAFLEKNGADGASCLLLDVQMPGTSGLELLEQLRTRAIAIPVIMMTANVERASARAVQAGALTVLRKPFSEDELLKWLNFACSLVPSAG
jgi:CheY-like chemotaxis protein